MRSLRILVIPVIVILVFAACGGKQKVGSEVALDFKENAGERLGGKAEETPAPGETAQGALSAGTKPTPAAPASPAPAQEQFFEVTLTPDSPFYAPGNAMHMPFTLTLRVTNRDSTGGRPFRTFTDKAGNFGSPQLAPGGVWTYKFGFLGTFEIVDNGLTFANATLEVTN